MASIPTVKIDSPGGGYTIINESDFDPGVHALYEGGGDEAEAEEVAEQSGADVEAVEAVDLREVPLRNLEEAVAEIDDRSVIEALLEADDRKGAVDIYEARLAELGE